MPDRGQTDIHVHLGNRITHRCERSRLANGTSR
ncbi:hypothetical protein JMJ77_0012853 [Colletotrichum scovillei]|uniref:Uncharacterized protein n=1 Tax=Colletotrichum scovillei TaxID=1209932 RepID=A0A9P7R7U7_9PEZI|nr:hypothetical protein JMJ77_0012853 [Colletotrichum scovillei]KAG7069137.1 hypothetical protein JMJ76_0002813 [Colletotrichum scovillei]KAG7073089.1 hypothetical protein JMJ78_0014070 [Colletotrichum scovillei]